jgi:PKD repeat protein
MLKGLKITLIFTVILCFIRCSSDSKNEPKAAFELNSEVVYQYLEVQIINKAQDASDVSYEVDGGDYVFVDKYKAIQFLEANTYSVTQKVKNGSGVDTYTLEIDVHPPNNFFVLDSEKFYTNNIAELDKDGFDFTYIKIFGENQMQEKPNLLMLYANFGKNPIEGQYYYNQTGEIGTYDAVIKAEIKNNQFKWTTKGSGSKELLTIDLVYEDKKNPKNNAYHITLPNYDLNYGEYVFFPEYYFKSFGNKTLTLEYIGIIKR